MISIPLSCSGVVEGIEADACSACGEQYLDPQAAAKIDAAAESNRRSRR
jgi:hypothetical protein